MLRSFVLAVGIVLLVIGLAALISAKPSVAIACLVWGGLIVIGILFERRIYKRIANTPPTGPGWTRTDERFVDEKSGKTITVYVKAATGERAYVFEAASGTERPAA